MENTTILIIGATVFGAILIVIFYKDIISIFFPQEEKQLPYKKKDFLLNVPERKFFEELQQIIPNKYVVFPQILLSNIVSVNSAKKEFWTYQNKINRKTIDFVIFEKSFLKPVLAIEYDGKTHSKQNRKLRDEFVDKVLDSSGIKILHIMHQKNINFEEVKNRINESLTNKDH